MAMLWQAMHIGHNHECILGELQYGSRPLPTVSALIFSVCLFHL